MYEVVHVDNVKIDYCETNHYNSVPTPFTIITEEEWRQSRHTWAINYLSHHQVRNKEQLQKLFGEDGGYASCYVEYHCDYAVAELVKTTWEDGGYKYKRVYVKIGCEHEWEYVEGDKYSTTHKCKKCGTIIETPTGY